MGRDVFLATLHGLATHPRFPKLNLERPPPTTTTTMYPLVQDVRAAHSGRGRLLCPLRGPICPGLHQCSTLWLCLLDPHPQLHVLGARGGPQPRPAVGCVRVQSVEGLHPACCLSVRRAATARLTIWGGGGCMRMETMLASLWHASCDPPSDVNHHPSNMRQACRTSTVTGTCRTLPPPLTFPSSAS